MPRHGPRAAAAAAAAAVVQTEPVPAPEQSEPPKGPFPGTILVARQYLFEQKVRKMMKENGCDVAREHTYRLQGVQLIDNIRQSLQLPVKTFDAACTYFHKFRLSFRDIEYNYQDAAMASLFVACKVEDTIKRSREIICAAHNLKNPDHPVTQDDKIFDQPHKILIGLERLILETIGFDFRIRIPQKLLHKVVRDLFTPAEAREFITTAGPMSIDIYKTYAPIKQSSFTMVMAMVELTAMITGTHVDQVQALDLRRYHTSRGAVVETMLDLLDLYAQHQKATKIGPRFDLSRFIDIKIGLNKEVDTTRHLCRFRQWCEQCEADERDGLSIITPVSATSPPATAGSGHGGDNNLKRTHRANGTMRFVFDADQAQEEQEMLGRFFKQEYEEVEIEVEEKIPQEPPSRNGGGGGGRASGGGSRRDRGHGRGHGHGHGHGPGQGPNHHDSGWAPYPRNRHHDGRHKGRKGSYYPG